MLLASSKHRIALSLKTRRTGRSAAWSPPLPVNHDVFPIKHLASASGVRCDCLFPLAQQHFAEYWLLCGSQWAATLYGFLSSLQNKDVYPWSAAKNTQRLFAFVLLEDLSPLSLFSNYILPSFICDLLLAALLISEAMHSCYREFKPWMRSA